MITLLTDFGVKDNFVAVMKAVMLKINSEISFVDITHDIRPQDKGEAAFVLKHSYGFFPRGTIHLVVVDPGVGSKRKAVLVETEDYYFIAPDNGVLSLALEQEKIKKVISIENSEYFLKPVSDTFHGRDIFAPVAAYLSAGIGIERFGPALKNIKRIKFQQPEIKKGVLAGEVIYIDNFGNLVTNIDRKLFKKFARKDFRIKIADKTIDKITHSYESVKANTPLAMWDSFDKLEISINKGNAANFLDAKIGSKIIVKK